MKSALSIGTASAEPGDLAFGKLICEPLADGAAAFIALIVVNGAHDGPILWSGSTIHGREIPGIEVNRRVAREIVDPATLRGAIVCAMPLNPYGFRLQRHTVPQDNGNINACFPGNPEGTLSERVAHVIWTQGVARCDYVIDFHANEPNGTEFACATPCENKEVLRRTVEMAEAFGFPLVQIRRDEWSYDRSLVAWAQDAGKPAILPEPCCQGILDADSIDAAVQGILNVLKYLDMIDGQIEPQKNIKGSGEHFRFVNLRVRKSGLAEYLVDGGNWVEKGQAVAIVRDPWGNERDRLFCPVDSYVRSVAPTSIVNAGQIVVTLLERHDRNELWDL
jgi:predicted deacylase